jgi:hypothetical protein
MWILTGLSLAARGPAIGTGSHRPRTYEGHSSTAGGRQGLHLTHPVL